MIDIEQARKHVEHLRLPITVERYDSGQIAFIARPMINGRRFNRSFSTSAYRSLEEAAEAAKEFCRGKHLTAQARGQELYPRIENTIIRQFERMTQEAVAAGIDPVQAYRDGIALHKAKKITELTLTQVIQNFMLSKRAENVTEPYLKELANYYKPIEMQLGQLKMTSITAQDIENWMEGLKAMGRIVTEGTRNRWLLKLGYLWDFALMPGRGWARHHVINELRAKGK